MSPLVKTFAFSVIGVATASVLIVPVFYNLLESKGQVGDAMKFSLAFQINPVDILSKLAIGGFDTASGWSAGPNLPNYLHRCFRISRFYPLLYNQSR